MIASVLGLFILLFRLAPAILRRRMQTPTGAPLPTVSVIVPARNEARNLPKLLTSLLQTHASEIVIINDESEDQTQAIAEAFAAQDSRVRVVRGAPRPSGWAGKNWACQQGALVSTGEYLLFTDADTEHINGSLERMIALDAGLSSALPFHSCEPWIERWMGPFHMLVFISSSAFSKPRKKSLFAIGQYLLFKRDWYFAQGMHEAIKASLADDLDLAERCLAMGGSYKLDMSGEIFKVRMYESFATFIAGWRRIFRVGFQHASVLRVVEVFLVIACLTQSFQFAKATVFETLCALAGLLILALAQRRFGNFSFLGVLLAPLGLGTFVYVSGAALYDRLLGRDLRWRGRSYKLSS